MGTDLPAPRPNSRPPSPDLAMEAAAVLLKPLWTLEDVATYLSMTVEAVRKMRKLNHLPRAYRVGKRLYWKREEFMEWFETYREDA